MCGGRSEREGTDVRYEGCGGPLDAKDEVDNVDGKTAGDRRRLVEGPSACLVLCDSCASTGHLGRGGLPTASVCSVKRAGTLIAGWNFEKR